VNVSVANLMYRYVPRGSFASIGISLLEALIPWNLQVAWSSEVNISWTGYQVTDHRLSESLSLREILYVEALS
jgi:hypothetical protein